tara:strand:+ start:805 stop:1125 length:321 start_codon:yes stop_codon:yes gene_type:complete
MKITYNNPSILVELIKGKDTNIVSKSTQLITIFTYLQDNTATVSMVCEATGIPQKNFCRFKRDLEKNGKLWEIEKKYCKKTGFKAWYLTTNQENAPSINQYKMDLI